MKLEISFDDGHISDLRAAKLLSAYGLKGTFYIPSCPVYRTIQMSLKEVKQIADMGHEIGGHTVSHPMDMKMLNDDDLIFQILNNKLLIEMCLMKKRPVNKFCYPRGRHDERVREAVKNAGFKEARTTLVLITDLPTDPFRTGTTIHMSTRNEYKGRDWFDVAVEQLKIAEEKGDQGMFSLWGHTQELDQQRDWDKFENLLRIIKQKTWKQ